MKRQDDMDLGAAPLLAVLVPEESEASSERRSYARSDIYTICELSYNRNSAAMTLSAPPTTMPHLPDSSISRRLARIVRSLEYTFLPFGPRKVLATRLATLVSTARHGPATWRES